MGQTILSIREQALGPTHPETLALRDRSSRFHEQTERAEDSESDSSSHDELG